VIISACVLLAPFVPKMTTGDEEEERKSGIVYILVNFFMSDERREEGGRKNSCDVRKKFQRGRIDFRGVKVVLKYFSRARQMTWKRISCSLLFWKRKSNTDKRRHREQHTTGT
jgi:hypothetical protein